MITETLNEFIQKLQVRLQVGHSNAPTWDAAIFERIDHLEQNWRDELARANELASALAGIARSSPQVKMQAREIMDEIRDIVRPPDDEQDSRMVTIIAAALAAPPEGWQDRREVQLGVIEFHSPRANPGLIERFYAVTKDLKDSGSIVDVWLMDIATVLGEFGYHMSITTNKPKPTPCYEPLPSSGSGETEPPR